MIRSGSYRYFIRGKNHTPAQDDAIVEHAHKQRLQAYDKFLKKFQYHNALDAALEVSWPSFPLSFFLAADLLW